MSNASELFGGGGGPQKWVTGAAYTEGKVVWSPADYQYYMRKTDGAGATDPASDSTNWQPTGDRAIKSIQRGTITGNGSSTITAVNPLKTELRSSSGAVNAATGYGWALAAALTNSTTVSTVGGNGNSSGLTCWELTERY